MNVVTFPAQLRKVTGGRELIYVDLPKQTRNKTLGGLFDCLEVECPGFKSRVLDTEGRLLKFLHVFIDQRNAKNINSDIAKAQEKKAVADGTQPKPPEILDIPLTGYEEIIILPAMAS